MLVFRHCLIVGFARTRIPLIVFLLSSLLCLISFLPISMFPIALLVRCRCILFPALLTITKIPVIVGAVAPTFFERSFLCLIFPRL
nr:hypothetical protein OVVYNVSZ_OVVYNVSZ_CDS_0001 [Microvirus sp.]